MKNSSLEEIWNKFEIKFKINEEIDFFTLSSLLRVIVEKENLKKRIEDLHYSIIHKFLHWESMRSDKAMFLISIVNILEKLPKIYNCEAIKKQILDNIPKKYDFFKIFAFGKHVRRKYKLTITNFNFFSYSEKIFFYTGKMADKTVDKKITFISKKKFTLRDTYEFSFQYVTINYGASIFMEIESQNFSLIIREKLHIKYSVSNYNELFPLLNSKKWPLPWNIKSEREILRDIYFYLTSDKKNIEYFYPFLKNPYIAKIALKQKDIDKIINSYNIGEKDKMEINKSRWKKEKDWKTEMEKNNLHYLEVDEFTFEDFSWGSNDFTKEKNDNKFLIHNKKAKEDYEIFQKLFKSNGEDIEDRNVLKIILQADLNNWGWKCEEGGKTSKKIINLLKGQGLLVLLGPAGHGKTFSLNEIIDFYLSKNLVVKLICPTWKAISLYENKIVSSTVENRIQNPKDNFFDNVDLLIIDEISLIEKWGFLSEIKKYTQIIFSGDINQLGPLTNDSKFRKHDWLFEVATEKKIINLKNGKNYRISKLTNNHDGAKILKNLIEEQFDFKHNAKNINYIYSIEEIFLKLRDLIEKNYTIITEFNGGMWGVDFLNRILKKGDSDKFEIGDRVVFVQTEQVIRTIDNQSKPEYYIGLFGEIIGMKIDNEDKEYLIKTNYNKNIEIVSSDDDIGDIIEHSYAINAYKAQGSTIENVVVLSPSKVGYDWLYTTVSRFSKNIEIIFIAGGSEYIEFVGRKK